MTISLVVTTTPWVYPQAEMLAPESPFAAGDTVEAFLTALGQGVQMEQNAVARQYENYRQAEQALRRAKKQTKNFWWNKKVVFWALLSLAIFTVPWVVGYYLPAGGVQNPLVFAFFVLFLLTEMVSFVSFWEALKESNDGRERHLYEYYEDIKYRFRWLTDHAWRQVREFYDGEEKDLALYQQDLIETITQAMPANEYTVSCLYYLAASVEGRGNNTVVLTEAAESYAGFLRLAARELAGSILPDFDPEVLSTFFKKMIKEKQFPLDSRLKMMMDELNAKDRAGLSGVQQEFGLFMLARLVELVEAGQKGDLELAVLLDRLEKFNDDDQQRIINDITPAMMGPETDFRGLRFLLRILAEGDWSWQRLVLARLEGEANVYGANKILDSLITGLPKLWWGLKILFQCMVVGGTAVFLYLKWPVIGGYSLIFVFLAAVGYYVVRRLLLGWLERIMAYLSSNFTPGGGTYTRKARKRLRDLGINDSWDEAGLLMDFEEYSAAGAGVIVSYHEIMDHCGDQLSGIALAHIECLSLMQVVISAGDEHHTYMVVLAACVDEGGRPILLLDEILGEQPTESEMIFIQELVAQYGWYCDFAGVLYADMAYRGGEKLFSNYTQTELALADTSRWVILKSFKPFAGTPFCRPRGKVKGDLVIFSEEEQFEHMLQLKEGAVSLYDLNIWRPEELTEEDLLYDWRRLRGELPEGDCGQSRGAVFCSEFTYEDGNIDFDNDLWNMVHMLVIDVLKNERYLELSEPEVDEVMNIIEFVFYQRLIWLTEEEKQFLEEKMKFKALFVSYSQAVAGDCRGDNRLAYVNLQAVLKILLDTVHGVELGRGYYRRELLVKLLGAQLGIYLSHEILGHEAGIADHGRLSVQDVQLLTQVMGDILDKQDIYGDLLDKLITAYEEICELGDPFLQTLRAEQASRAVDEETRERAARQLTSQGPLWTVPLRLRSGLLDIEGSVWQKEPWTVADLNQELRRFRGGERCAPLGAIGVEMMQYDEYKGNLHVSGIDRHMGLTMSAGDRKEIRHLISRVARRRYDKYLDADQQAITEEKAIDLVFVHESQVIAGGCWEKELAFINLRALRKIARDAVGRFEGSQVEKRSFRKCVYGVLLGVFLSHIMLGRGVGINDERVLLEQDAQLLAEMLSAELIKQTGALGYQLKLQAVREALIKSLEPESMFRWGLNHELVANSRGFVRKTEEKFARVKIEQVVSYRRLLKVLVAAERYRGKQRQFFIPPEANSENSRADIVDAALDFFCKLLGLKKRDGEDAEALQSRITNALEEIDLLVDEETEIGTVAGSVLAVLRPVLASVGMLIVYQEMGVSRLFDSSWGKFNKAVVGEKRGNFNDIFRKLLAVFNCSGSIVGKLRDDVKVEKGAGDFVDDIGVMSGVSPGLKKQIEELLRSFYREKGRLFHEYNHPQEVLRRALAYLDHDPEMKKLYDCVDGFLTGSLKGALFPLIEKKLALALAITFLIDDYQQGRDRSKCEVSPWEAHLFELLDSV